MPYLIDYTYILIDYLYQLLVLAENKGHFNRLLCNFNHLRAFVCNPLHLFVFTSSTTIITTFTPDTYLRQPNRLSLSLKANQNLSINHTNTSSKSFCYHPSLNPNIFCSQTLCLHFKMASNPSRAQKKAKTSQRKQGE